ncbi:OmpA family protein [Taibaiella soli]|nr:OmpA family protein [Taibaiella soli]
MKIKFLLPVLLLCSFWANAQKMQGIGIHFGGYDFYGPQTNNYLFSDQYHYSYNSEKGAYDTSTRSHLFWNPMVKFTYWFQLNKHLDLNLGLSLANLEYPTDRPDSDYINKYHYNTAGTRNEKFLGEFDARINYNIIPKEDYLFSPYVFAGINASYHDIFWGADIPLGIGVNVNLSGKKTNPIYLNLESGYKIAGTDHDQNHLQHSIGIVYWFKPGYKPPKAVTPPPPVIIKDTDNDGVPDDEDACPTIAGPAALNGCPDSDNDGIADNKDECPLVAGLPQFNGCPDSDGDGIPDNKDKCPYVAGLAQYDGCPPPDADKDGVPDTEDRCPNDPGPASNQGCPEIKQETVRQVEKAAKAIFFETGKATIKKASYKQLDVVVKVMKDNPSYFADIEGHTDNVGSHDLNMGLSQKRAEAVKNYFVKKGISEDRLTAQGFGETQPIATNETATGRAANRRTVIKLRNFKK